jgi:glycosyltransferase involved in cell wall biosynthesis
VARWGSDHIDNWLFRKYLPSTPIFAPSGDIVGPHEITDNSVSALERASDGADVIIAYSFAGFTSPRMPRSSTGNRPMIHIEPGSIQPAVDPIRCLPRSTRISTRQKWGFEGKFVAGYLGEISEWKKVDRLIEAMGLLPESWGLALMGDWGLDWLLPDRIVHIGHKWHVGDFLNAIDVMVLPGSYDTEPLAAKEAQFLGKHVIMNEAFGGILPIDCKPGEIARACLFGANRRINTSDIVAIMQDCMPRRAAQLEERLLKAVVRGNS